MSLPLREKINHKCQSTEILSQLVLKSLLIHVLWFFPNYSGCRNPKGKLNYSFGKKMALPCYSKREYPYEIAFDPWERKLTFQTLSCVCV